MLIIGRSAPPTPMWRMRSKQTLCLVEEADLAFTPQEAADLFASYGLGAADARAALEQTRGRAAALDKTAAWMSRAEAGTHHVERNSPRRVAGGSRVYPPNSQPRRGGRRAVGR
jgi:ATP/maltotriose-dependent transcriptional regulator MalT